MKIYNEVVIDMNPESSSYGETLHEDSFEHDGDMMLLYRGEIVSTDDSDDKLVNPGSPQMPNIGDTMSTKEGAKQVLLYNNKEYTSSAQLPYSAQWGQDKNKVESVLKYPIYKYDESGTWKATGDFTEHSTPQSSHYDKSSMAPGGTVEDMGDDFTFTRDDEGLIDPTREEFKEYVGTTGGYDAIATGLGLDPADFDEAYLDPLKFQEQEFDIQRDELALEQDMFGIQRKELGLQEEGFEFDSQALSENLRSATESYDIGRRRVGLQTGQSLFDIKRQVEGQQARGGFAGSGAVAATGKRAQKGVMADYNLQQRALASQMTGAKSAFDIGTGRLDLSRQGLGLLGEKLDIAEAGAVFAGERIDLGQERFESEFWKAEEDRFYNEADYLESLTTG